jgi:transcriptional regulator with XRE-family HTH domain
MALDQRDIQETIDRVSARQDFLEACKRHDLGALIEILGRHGVTQGQMANLTGIAQGRLSNYKHGKNVPMASHIFQAFADGLSLSAQARTLLGLAPSGDRAATPLLTDGLAVPVDTFDLQVLAETIGRWGNDVKRREMLSLAAQVGATAAIAQSDVWERLAHALMKPSAMDESIIREMEARSAGFHRLEEVTPAPALFKALVAHLRELSSLLNGTATDPADELRRRLIIVAGESSVLAGWTASDMGDAVLARNYYETAARAAKEADDLAIAACALGYQSYIPSTRGRNGHSRILLTEALQAAESAKASSPGTVSWLAARHAEESATLGDKQQALKSWDQAAEAFNIAYPEEDRVWTRFLDQNRFDSYRIATYAKIGRLD